MQSVFISGTDTDIGKTIVSAWLALHWRAAYWKPVQSGLDGESDSETVARLAGVHCYPEIWRFKNALSPHQAAADEKKYIDFAELRFPVFRKNEQRLIVEGAGGLLTPLNESACIADLIGQLDLPILLVARSALGTINHTCLTVEAIRARKLPLLGVIMVGALNPANRIAIEHYARVPVLAELPALAEISRTHLEQCIFPNKLYEALSLLSDIDY